MSFRSAITNNMSIKVAAAIVAVAFWMFAKGEQTADRSFSIPLVLRNVPEGVTTVERIPETIDVILAGDNKELVKLGLWGEPFAVVDMSGAEADQTFRVSLSPGNVVLPRDANVQVVEVRDPRSLDLEVDELEERRVRVAPFIEGAPADGFYVLGTERSIPESVTIYGPSRVVSRLGAVRTAALSVAGRRNRVEATRRIEFDEAWNLHAVPREVRVAVEIEGTRVVTLSEVPTVFEHEPGFNAATVLPDLVELSLSGPEHLAVSLTAADVTVLVDAKGLPRGVHELVPEITVPDGIEIHGMIPPRVTVTLQ